MNKLIIWPLFLCGAIIASLLSIKGFIWLQEEHPEGNWSELCAITDCEQYPVEYGTRKIFGKHYYFPVGMVPNAKYTELADATKDTKSTKIKRNYSETDYSYTISGCCSGLYEHFDIDYKKYSTGKGISQFVHLTRGFDSTYIRRVVFERLMEEPESYLQDFDANFYILTPDSPLVKAKLFLSKDTLFFNSRVILQCTRKYCDIATYSTDTDSIFPDMTVALVNTSYKKCGEDFLNCPTYRRSISEKAGQIKDFETLLTLLQVYPKNEIDNE